MPSMVINSLGVPTSAAFGARAVVAFNVYDKRVVELAQVVDRLDHSPDLVIGICDIGGEHLCLAREQLLAVGIQAIPLRQVIRPGRQLRVCRNDPEPFLVGENLLAQLVPTHVELALELIDPFLGRMMRRVGAARHVVDEERPCRVLPHSVA